MASSIILCGKALNTAPGKPKRLLNTANIPVFEALFCSTP
jgi:hypothetical protein